MGNDDKRLNFLRFLGDWFLRNCIAIFLLAAVVQYWFHPYMYGLLVLLIISWIYSSWLTVQEQFFWKEEFNFNLRDWTLWAVWLIECIFLLIAFYFLNKGLLTITGAEQAFGFSWILISEVMSIGFILFMFYLLRIIKKVERIRLFVFLYILLDFLVLMPFNFMYMFEAKQRDDLADFYAGIIPTLYTRLDSRISAKIGELDKNLIQPKSKESGIKKKYENKKLEIKQLEDNLIERQKEQEIEYNEARARIIKRLERELKAATNSRDNLNATQIPVLEQINIDKKRYTDYRDSLTAIKDTVNRIRNGISVSELKINTISACKNRLLQLVNQDPYFLQDTLILRAQEKLSIEASSRTEAFFQLLHDLFQPLLKEKPTAAGLIVEKKVDPEWQALQPSVRWFSFLAALLIDVIPLLAVLVYRLYNR
ncbi:MAG: hypothetical protein H7Z72_21830 [Bacteroidetes bacterium]|nr:hypothetical protein [Fibrella sp.]